MKNVPVINENKYYEYDNDLVAGSAESYGWEFMLQYNDLPLNATASYSLNWAYKTVDDYVYYPKYDTRHSVNISVDYEIGWGIHSRAMWVYSSGLPFTKLQGFYDKYYPGNVYDNPFYSGSYSPYSILGDKNTGRLPQYHRLDLGISKKFALPFCVMDLDVSVINVYNRKNIFYFKRDTGERVYMLPFLPTATLKIEI